MICKHDGFYYPVPGSSFIFATGLYRSKSLNLPIPVDYEREVKCFG